MLNTELRMPVGCAAVLIALVLGIAAPLRAADSPTSAPAAALTPERKTAMDALDGVISRYEALVSRDDVADHKAAAQAALDGFKDRRAEIRKAFDQGRYDELRVDLNLSYQRQAAWVKPPTILALATTLPAQVGATPEALNARFALAGKAGAPQLKFITGEGGLICADINTAACTGRVYLLGGTVTAWQPAGQEPVIFMSSKSQYAVGKAMRGGVPVCFPWYDGKASSSVAGVGGPGGPQHGMVRIIEWQVEETKDLGDGAVSITLGSSSDEATKKFWPFDYQLHEHVTFGKQLQVEVAVKNVGAEAMKYEEDLHAYYYFKDVRQASILGLDGADFIDKYDGGKHKKQQGPIPLSVAADSTYLATAATMTLVDESLSRRITIEKIDSQNTTVWTPGSTRAVGDLGPDQWMNFACIEIANVGETAPTVKPGETKSMGFRVSVGK